jgi:ParB-like nuclease domain
MGRTVRDRAIEQEKGRPELIRIGVGGARARKLLGIRALQPAKVDELAESMKKSGQLQPIVLRRSTNNLGKGNIQ